MLNTEKAPYQVEVETIQRTAEDISATKVRKALKDGNFESFKSMMPKELWDMFDELREYINK